MKQLIFILNFILFSSAAFAINDTRDLDSFSELEVSEGITVELIHGKKHSAIIHVVDGNSDDLVTNVSNGILNIYWKKGMGNNRYATILLNYTMLKKISSSSGAKVMSDFIIKSSNLELNASSGGNISLEIECDELSAEVSSGSKLKLKGKTNNQDVDASSGGSYKAADLQSDSATVDASSGASILINASTTLNADASSGASIKYKGNPSNKNFDVSELTGASISTM